MSRTLSGAEDQSEFASCEPLPQAFVAGAYGIAWRRCCVDGLLFVS